MAILYTGDLHFGHQNVIRFDNRPFQDVGEMDAYLIKMWDQKVQPDDDVYILGDVCFRNGNPPETYLRQLNGIKHLIIGNHDTKLLKNPKATACFESIEQLSIITDAKRIVVLCHYPLAEWPNMYRNAYHIYGHIHNADNEISKFMQAKEKAFNAGCMVNGYQPVTLDEMIKTQKKGIK